jgi:sigma-B regulation protein RsbU (phosphoserine phosphatase)
MKILVVDDDRIARKVLRAFLEEANYEVLVAEDGRSAIDMLLGGDAPPIVILDWVMPGMSGPEVCAKLRASRLKTRPYVLMLSAKTDKAEVVAGLDAGADDFLSKPFNLGELLARLRVAQRMIEYEFDLAKKIAEYESLEQRHQLLGELIATSPQSDPTHAGEIGRASCRERVY